MKPYTYIIKHKPTGKVYYGFRSANKVDPSKDLWQKYFTSSPGVKKLIAETGKESFETEIRKVFETKEAATKWETTVLRRCKVLHSDKWLNQNVAGYIIPTEESNKKISEFHKGKPKTEEHKRKISKSNKGRKHKPVTDEFRKNMSKIKSGSGNGMYGKKHSDETKAKISKANKGTVSKFKGVPLTAEHKEKISKSKKGTKRSQSAIDATVAKQRGQKREKKYCPHCKRYIAVGWFNRHGDNCNDK